MSPAWQLLAVVHLSLAAAWAGAMSYSLVVLQPKVARYFNAPRQREEFLTTLAHGNRRPVLGLAGALVVTGTAVALTGPATVTAGFLVALGCQLAALAVFWQVSWRHWPARVFALPAELPGYQRRLRQLAWTMSLLVWTGFVAALAGGIAG